MTAAATDHRQTKAVRNLGLFCELPLSIDRLKANGCNVHLHGNQGFMLSADITDVMNDTKLDFSNC